MIAMALACEPALPIADEPTTGLDVTTQAVIMDLINENLGRYTNFVNPLDLAALAVPQRVSTKWAAGGRDPRGAGIS